MSFDIHHTDIQEAKARISPHIRKTPLVESNALQRLLGIRCLLKCENLQKTGAFKSRGATNKLLSLSKDVLAQGVVTASAGNHGQALAYMAGILGAKATVFMPEKTPIIKIANTKSYGANAVITGESYDEAYQAALEFSKNQNATFVPAFADPMVIAGQGTIGLEILDEELPDWVVVPVGGGGLISGIAIALKELHPKIKVIGVQAAGAPAMANAFHTGKLLKSEQITTIADGIAVKRPNEDTYELIKKYVDEIYTVTEDEISQGIAFSLESHKLLLEGAGAAALAAVLGEKSKTFKQGLGTIILSGGNIDLNLLSRIIERGLCSSGRIFRSKVLIEDQPGALSKLAGLIAQEKANILQVIHTRANRTLGLNQIEVDLTIETINDQHIQTLKERLTEAGCRVIEE